MACSITSLVVWLVAMAAFLQATSATEYEVGGSFGWNVPPNSSFYSEWASTETFFVGDELEFISNNTENRGVATVSTKSEYDNCTYSGTWYEGLTHILANSGPSYFLSPVRNHCEAGQKVTINVLTRPGSTPPNSAPSLAYGSVYALLFTTAAVFSLTLHRTSINQEI